MLGRNMLNRSSGKKEISYNVTKEEDPHWKTYLVAFLGHVDASETT